MKEVLFFWNGNTAFLDGEQKPEIQNTSGIGAGPKEMRGNQSWLLLYAKFLESKGIDPTEPAYILPNGRTARLFRVGDSWNWRIADE